MIVISLSSALGPERIRKSLSQLNLDFALTDLGNGETLLAFSVDALHVSTYTHVKKLVEPFAPIDLSSVITKRNSYVRRIQGTDKAV